MLWIPETSDKTIINEGSYSGKPTLIFGENNRFPLAFGQAKARLLLAAIEHLGVEKFVQVIKEFAGKRDI